MLINRSSTRRVNVQKIRSQQILEEIRHRYHSVQRRKLFELDQLWTFKIRTVASQGSTAVIRYLQSIVCEKGAPKKILTDNDTAFRSEETRKFLENWSMHLNFRVASCPSGNGIIERNRRTFKMLPER